MNLREAAQQALEAMEKATRFMSDSDYKKLNQAIEALRAALAEKAEPVAWMDREGDIYPMPEIEHWAPPHVFLYAAPPQRKPLTSVELVQIELRLRIYYDYDTYDLSLHDFARAIERAHGIGGEA